MAGEAWSAENSPRILLAMPSKGSAHGVSEWFCDALFAIRVTCPNLTTATISGMPWAEARNNLAIMAMEKGCDYIFYLDDDIIAPADVVQRLIAHNVDICGLSYKQKIFPHSWCAFNSYIDVHGLEQKTPITPTGDLIPVDYIGAGCLLVSRKVFQILAYPWFRWTVDATNLNGKSEDFYFCEKARDAGFKIWWDSTMPQAGHVCTAILTADGFTQVQ